MCLVAVAWKIHPHWRVVLAGNRDEFHARPTAPLAAWQEVSGLKAGRDLQSGGTWVGADAHGRCAVVTNVRARPAVTAEPSRGQLPVQFLRGHRDALSSAAALASDAAAYAPFNLLLIDADACVYLGNHPGLQCHAIAPGIHGMSNGGFDMRWPKTRRLCKSMQQWTEAGSEAFDSLWSALADERVAADSELPDTGMGMELERRLSAAFIRGDTYGTRASTLIAIDYEGRSFIGERRFGPNGVFEGQTTLRNDA
ncbi:MAG: NRDE family protein [Pseudoxanthomonas sp.]